MADFRTPDGLDDLAIALEGCEREVAFRHARLGVPQEIIEHVVARSPAGAAALDVVDVAEVRELFRELECAIGNATSDVLELFSSGRWWGDSARR